MEVFHQQFRKVNEMNWKKTTIMLIALIVIVNTQFAAAGSHYARKNRNSKSLYVDDKAGKVGDILTILISEVTEIESKLKRKLEQR